MTGIQPWERGEFIDKKQSSFNRRISFRKAEGGGSQKAVFLFTITPTDNQ
ncbi:MAG: hypothetical protein K8R63_09485 [Bacteroidales bacterium]|nr:hypothetical protein [Bacteroidales bacterium]